MGAVLFQKLLSHVLTVGLLIGHCLLMTIMFVRMKIKKNLELVNVEKKAINDVCFRLDEDEFIIGLRILNSEAWYFKGIPVSEIPKLIEYLDSLIKK